VFYEITKNAVRQAVAEPRGLSLELVNAQQARRALDYLVGFNLSPLLWKKVRRGLSAGRVQSPALRMICEREAEIAAFNAQEYWTLDGEGEHSQQRFPLKLIEYLGAKTEQFSFVNETQAREVEHAIKAAAGATAATPGQLRVLAIDRKQRRRNPAPPFTTSTLQQEAARKLGFNARRTMRLAQQLYEGVEIGAEGSVGLITYMRTDSVSLAAEAVSELRAGRSQALRPGKRRRRSARLQDQIKECTGSARVDPADVSRDHAGGHRGQDRRRSFPSVCAHLETRGRLSNESRGV
jgi:DNA topoisomerase-1